MTEEEYIKCWLAENPKKAEKFRKRLKPNASLSDQLDLIMSLGGRDAVLEIIDLYGAQTLEEIVEMAEND